MGGSTALLQFPSEFRTLVDDLRAILWEIDSPARRFTFVSRHAEEVLGYPVAQWLQEPGFWENHMHPEDRESVLAKCAQLTIEGADHQLEYRMIAASGRVIWLRHIVRAVKDSQGRTAKFRGVMVDITEQREAIQALQENEERFRAAFQDSPIAMRLLGCDFRVKAVNHAFCKLVGREQREILQLGSPGFIHPDDWPRSSALVQQLFAGAIPNYKLQKRYINAKGETIWVDFFCALVRDSGNTRSALGIAVDITEQKRAEEALHELSGRLMCLQEEERRRIGRELHDSTGQNLAALKLNLSRLDRAALSPDLGNLVADSLRLTDRMLAEIRTLSHLLHPPLLDELGLASAIRVYVEGFRARSGIAVHLEISQDLGRYEPQLETAIFRIIQEGLTNTYRHSGGGQCWIVVQREDHHLRLELRDDGVGLPLEIREALKHGTPALGVGLAGMRERARQLQGWLEIESSGSGCTLRSIFPISGQTHA